MLTMNWNDIHSQLIEFYKIASHDFELPDFSITLPPESWYVWKNCKWKKVETLPDCFIFDAESVRIGSWWAPTVCIAVDSKTNIYKFVPLKETLVPVPKNSIIIGHNVSEFDSQFLDKSYEIEFGSKVTYIDTIGLVALLNGLGDSQHGIYDKYRKAHEMQKPTIPWFNCATRLGLCDAYMFYTGKKVEKSINGNDNSLNNMDEICLQDCLMTLEVLKATYTKLFNIVNNDDFWIGRALLSGLTGFTFSKDWVELDRKSSNELGKIKIVNGVIPSRTSFTSPYGDVTSKPWKYHNMLNYLTTGHNKQYTIVNTDTAMKSGFWFSPSAAIKASQHEYERFTETLREWSALYVSMANIEMSQTTRLVAISDYKLLYQHDVNSDKNAKYEFLLRNKSLAEYTI
jgi:DNA mitochondrial polymerase exonuclease domain